MTVTAIQPSPKAIVINVNIPRRVSLTHRIQYGIDQACHVILSANATAPSGTVTKVQVFACGSPDQVLH